MHTTLHMLSYEVVQSKKKKKIYVSIIQIMINEKRMGNLKLHSKVKTIYFILSYMWNNQYTIL